MGRLEKIVLRIIRLIKSAIAEAQALYQRIRGAIDE